MSAYTTTIKGTGIVSSTDFKTVTFTGKTKKGNNVTITLPNAINMSNIDLSFVEKDDTVAQLVFSSAYSNEHNMVSTAGDYEENWSITYGADSSDGNADCILLGAGVVSIGGIDVGLTRGGSQFTVEREFREINADGDRGVVKGRVVIDASRATLTVNALTWLKDIDHVFAAIDVATTA